jgi:2,3-bisphosphoglycerate-dependent phosphoglycerate mutase
MTELYFIRHAEPNYRNQNDETRELTPKGLNDRRLVTAFLKDKAIDIVLSSPYKRAYDTIIDFAQRYGYAVKTIDDFRERKVDSVWIDDFTAFSKRQWSDFSYKLSDGESLSEVQKRNIAALNAVLKDYKDKKIVVGSHGTALSTIINYYDQTFGYAEFEKIKSLMPWIVKFTFSDMDFVSIETVDLFKE